MDDTFIDQASERTYKRRRLCTVVISFAIFVFVLTMFIVSVIKANTGRYDACPASIATIASLKIYYVFDNGKKTNTSFVDVKYIINKVIYENITSTELEQKYQLQTMFSENGAIKVYKECAVDRANDYYLSPTFIYTANKWMMLTIIFGHLLAISSFIIVIYCCMVFLVNGRVLDRCLS